MTSDRPKEQKAEELGSPVVMVSTTTVYMSQLNLNNS